VELYIRNNENSDAILRNVTLDIYDINGSGEGAHYHPESVYVIKAGEAIKRHIPDALLSTDSTYVRDIPLGDIEAKDRSYIDYQIDPQSLYIDMPLHAHVNMTLDLLTGVTYPINRYPLDAMPLCAEDNETYGGITYGQFNVEDEGLSDPANGVHYFDLPTQVVHRVGRFLIRAYRADDPNVPMEVTTMVGVEVTDAAKYHDKTAACFEPDNRVSTRIWLPFANINGSSNDTNVSAVALNRSTIQYAINDGRTAGVILNQPDRITDPSEFFGIARRNAAFRIIYPEANSTLVTITKIGSNRWVIDRIDDVIAHTAQCHRPVINPYAPGLTTTSPSVACELGRNGTTLNNIAICMECVYGQSESTNYLCSRDNFAIRPKSYRIALYDQNTSSGSDSLITVNDNDTLFNLAAGYDYYVEINATRYDDDNNSRGYVQRFHQENVSNDNNFSFVWQEVGGHGDCTVETDFNNTVQFIDGTANSREVKAGDIGRYDLRIVDMEYTKVDWDSEKMQHQQNNEFFLPGSDCIKGSAIAAAEAALTQIDNTNLANTNGCVIRSDSDDEHKNIRVHFYPYAFDTNLTVTFGAGGPDRPNPSPYIYINTPPSTLGEDFNMSINIDGVYRAVGFDGNTTRNFTNGCWAENTNLTLLLNKLRADDETSTPNLSFAIRDVNATNPARVYRPASGGSNAFERNLNQIDTDANITIAQGASYYPKETQGELGIQLRINYDRDPRLPLNPRFFHIGNFIISYAYNPSSIYVNMSQNHVIQGIHGLNQNITFVYGRILPAQTLYDDVTAAQVTTPVSMAVYCDFLPNVCQQHGIVTNNTATPYFGWWINPNHDSDQGDGTIDLRINHNPPAGNIVLGGTPIPVGTTPANPVNNALFVQRDNLVTLPVTAFIFVNNRANFARTSPWLDYYLNSNDPLFRVRFIGAPNWAGEGDTGNVVGGNVNIRKNQRLGW
jgi:hypothetical protein